MVTHGERRGELLRQQAEARWEVQNASGDAISLSAFAGSLLLALGILSFYVYINVDRVWSLIGDVMNAAKRCFAMSLSDCCKPASQCISKQSLTPLCLMKSIPRHPVKTAER